MYGTEEVTTWAEKNLFFLLKESLTKSTSWN